MQNCYLLLCCCLFLKIFHTIPCCWSLYLYWRQIETFKIFRQNNTKHILKLATSAKKFLLITILSCPKNNSVQYKSNPRSHIALSYNFKYQTSSVLETLQLFEKSFLGVRKKTQGQLCWYVARSKQCHSVFLLLIRQTERERNFRTIIIDE